jgi:hypothetical protein
MELRKQGAENSAMIKAINESLKGLSSWVPQVDKTIKTSQKSMAVVTAQVNALESSPGLAHVVTPRPEWHSEEHQNQGHVAGVSRASTLALDKGTRTNPHSHVRFDMGDNSEMYTETAQFGSRHGHSRSRPPKTEFPRFDGDKPKWWKTACEKYFTLYAVDHDTCESFATTHFTGNATQRLQKL